MDMRLARGERSRARLKEAFLELVANKEPEEISVVEVCEKAELNRSTFYAHYDYLDKLIRDVIWGHVEKLLAAFSKQWELPLEHGGVDKTYISLYIDRFLNDSTLIRLCGCANHAKYRTLLIRAHIELAIGETNDSARYYAAYCHNAGVLNLLVEWINNGFPIPKEAIVDIIHESSKVMYQSR